MESYPQIKITHNIGNTIEIPNQLDVRATTYISDNIASGVVAVPVDNAGDFNDDDILIMVSSLGAENCEIVQSTTHTNQSFTVLATSMSHNRGDLVSEIKYDQIVISKSSTETGDYSIIGTYDFNVTNQKTIIYDNDGLMTDYYKVQWKNSITEELSTASPAVSVSSYSQFSVANVVFPVLKSMGVSENDPKITIDFCLSAINDARIYTDSKLFGIRHAWRQVFEHPVRILAGTNCVDLPEDVDFKETDRSILSARFIIDNILSPFNLSYIPKRNWNQITESIAGGEVSNTVDIGANEIELDNVGDFISSTDSVAYVATTDYSEEIMQITYTDINISENKLTGVSGVTRSIPIGTRVWSRPTISQPTAYTVWGGKLYFDRVVPDSMQGKNVYLDYYKGLDPVVSLSQELPENYREIYKWYLRYAIKYRKDNSLPTSDPDYKKFEELVDALFKNLYTGQDTIIIN